MRSSASTNGSGAGPCAQREQVAASGPRGYPVSARGRRRRAHGPPLVAAVAIGIVGGWIVGRNLTDRAMGSAERAVEGSAPSVRTASAEAADVPVVITALGTVSAEVTITVKSKISGDLTRIAFREGQVVREGDLLAEIDARPFHAAVAQYRAQLMKDEALLRSAQLTLERYRRLGAQDSISRQNIDTQAALVQQYEAVKKSDEAQLEMQELDLANCRIVSPVEGRVGLRQVDVGNYVAPTDKSGIAMITQMQPISVILSVPERDLATIMKVMRAGGAVDVRAYDRADSVEIAAGVLGALDNQIDTSTGMVKLRARFDNRDESLFPGQFVNVRVLVETLQNAVTVPASAVQQGVIGSYVYLLRENSTVALTKVEAGPGVRDRTMIRDGLRAGDRVVVDGSDRLTDGTRVRVVAPEQLSRVEELPVDRVKAQ